MSPTALAPAREALNKQIGKRVEVSLQRSPDMQRHLPSALQMRVRYVALDAPTRQRSKTLSR